MNEEVIKEIRLFLLSLFLVEETKSEKEYFQKLYMLSNHIVENYKIFYIRKRNGKVRTIYEPSKMLKFAQRRILDTILAEKKITPVATAYKKGNGRADDDTDDTALEQKRLQRCAWFCADPAVSYGENNDCIAGRHGQNQQDENKTCS